MTLYKFYWRDKTERVLLIGVLPERRRISQRITQESIINWVRKMPFDAEVNVNKVYFTSIKV